MIWYNKGMKTNADKAVCTISIFSHSWNEVCNLLAFHV